MSTELSIEKCAACPVVCELRDQARSVLDALPLAEITGDILEEQYRDAQRQVDHHDLLLAEEKVITDMLGLPDTTDYSPEDHIAAIDEAMKASDLYGNDSYRYSMLRKDGAGWAGNVLRLADDIESSCDRGVRHGIRMPLVDVVIPTTERIGSDYCGSNPTLRAHADFWLRLGEIGITDHLNNES